MSRLRRLVESDRWLRKAGVYPPEPGEGGMGKPSGGLAVVERP